MPSEPTVFVVDDDQTVLASVRWLLESEDLSVETHASATGFLESYDPDRTGCMVLDMCMPGMDGLELQRELAARGASLPIVFVSGYGNVAHCAAAMKAGAVDFLEKPADDERILAAVRAALQADRGRCMVGTANPQIAARVDRLTPRERGVMERLCQGDTIKTMAAAFGVSFQTVAKHRARVFEKLNVRNEVELVRLMGGLPLGKDQVPSPPLHRHARYSHAAVR